MSTGLKMLSGVLIHMRRSKDTVNLPFSWQWYWPYGCCSSVISCFDDFFAGQIKHAAVKCLEADADLLLSDRGGHGNAGSDP